MEMKPTKMGENLMNAVNFEHSPRTSDQPLHRCRLPETDLTQKPTRVEPEYARAKCSNYLVGEAFANLTPSYE